MFFCAGSVSLLETFALNWLMVRWEPQQWGPHSPIYHTLISTSTPEGSSSFISASIVLGVDE